ncbi:endonuclease/exonuclease/phosphatase family protein [Candidatus Chloroploca sp. Khr17]|uniref:endonuclease/exonuclease/phosphatase family protein n=1 Tax=Candidatus Chloroploca sp. Khr17 TaxID=2496869 RepID=UPI0013EBF733|nr:endonuclease/exonuclease/phosphatase family protein [Candidatus Chloroploca sp. Khr17]
MQRQRQRQRVLDGLLALYPMGLIGLTLVALVAPQRTGLMALTQVFAHFLFLPLLLLLPLALLMRLSFLRLALGAALAVFLIVYPPAFAVGPPAPPATGAQVRIMTWNLFYGRVSAAQLQVQLEAYQPDILLVQEMLGEGFVVSEWLTTQYPYHFIGSYTTAPGMAIFSRYPILEASVPQFAEAHWDMPRIIWARLDIEGHRLSVINAHPIPPRTFGTNCAVLRCYNQGPRDAQIVDLRRFVDEIRAQSDDPLILGGDMNVTEREEAYFDLAHGLVDVHRAVGRGFGASWRPGMLQVPFGLLRIDYFFTAPGVRPRTLITDCQWYGSDHCLLVGDFGVEERGVVGKP